VRKAQKQHRQRKADYIKELEIDVASIRDLIAQAQQETHRLKLENDAMKARIQQPLAFPAKPTLLTPSPPFDIPLPTPNTIAPASYGLGLGLEDITLSLRFDDILNAPTFHINSSPSSSHYESSSHSLSFPDTTTTTATSPSIPDTTPDQTQEAINFILALESVCRNHFHPSPGQKPGHTLMATSLALRTAPPSVFTAANKSAPLLRSAKPSDLPKQGQCEWQAAGLSLHSLHGLACSIADAEVEITPVQAWFELSGRFKLEVLLRREVLDGLKRELCELVRCPHFGAVMEREAFESVVGRVLGGFEGEVLGGFEVDGLGMGREGFVLETGGSWV